MPKKPRRMARLVYLAAKLKTSTPRLPRDLQRYFPYAELIDAVKLGAEGASATLDIPTDQLKQLFKEGRNGSEVTPAEYRTLVAREISDNPQLDELPFDKKLGILGRISKFVNDEGSMVAYGRVNLGNPGEVSELQKWDTGFHPIDITTGGLYQGILIIMAKPGVGKTSTMLSMMSAIKENYPDTKTFFFEMEIPEPLMLSRMQPLFKRKLFTNDDVLICGGLSVDEIRQELESEKDVANSVVFIDSPDTMPGMSTENRRFELGRIYRELVRIKEMCKLVVVASQPSRRARPPYTLESMAESWEKAWLSDIVAGIWTVGFEKYKLRILKNRFGLSEQEVTYTYNLQDLTWENPIMDDEDW